MSGPFEKLIAIQQDNDLLRHKIALSKLKRTEARRNAEKMAEENYYLEKALNDVKDRIAKLKSEQEALSSKRSRRRSSSRNSAY